MSSATFSVWFNPILGFLCTRGFYRKFPQGGLKKFSKLILKKFSIFWPSFEKILHIFPIFAKYNLSLVAHFLRAIPPFWGFSAHAKYKLVVCCTSFLCYHPISGFLCTCQIKFSSLWHISCVLPPHAKYNFSLLVCFL